jgi:hypothetical protein
MLRHHTGSGRRRAVPVEWGRNHTAVLAGTRNATGTLRRPTVDDDDGWGESGSRETTPAAGVPYAEQITARIQSLITHRSDAQRVVAEEDILTASYLVTVDYELDVDEGHTFTVETCPGDPAMVGRVFLVEHVVLGTERFERDLFCNLDEQAPPTN